MRVALLVVSALCASVCTVPAAGQGVVPTADGPIHQLRIYQLLDETKAAFHKRFRDDAARIMKRHGFTIVAMWEARANEKPEFVYLLSWPNEAAKAVAWAAFMADPEWAEIKRHTSAANGRMMGSIEDRTIRLTDYSPPFPSGATGRKR